MQMATRDRDPHPADRRRARRRRRGRRSRARSTRRLRGRSGAACGTISCCASAASAIDDRSFIALARRFGEIEPPEAHTRTAEMTVPGFPEMSIISNLIEDGVARGEAGDGELRWHTDHGFMERPVALSMLLARALPDAGGDTSFANMYRGLRASCRTRSSGGSRGSRSSIREPFLDRQAAAGLAGISRATIRASCRARCIRSCAPIPRAGRKGLYLGRRFGAYIPPLPLDGERGAAGRALGARDPRASWPGPSAGSSAT